MLLCFKWPPNLSISLSWSLDRTVENAVTFLINCIDTATKGDVYAGAVAAATSFGPTLAMNPATRRKIVTLAGLQSDPVVVRFLKSSIDYAAGGSLRYCVGPWLVSTFWP
jgi:hypothetical protein